MADPWVFTTQTDATFDFEGDHYVMQPNSPSATYQTDDACQMKRFMAAWRQATSGTVTDDRPNAQADLDEACPPGDAPADQGPTIPSANTDPSAGVTDSPPAAGDESPQTLSAPAVTPDATLDSSPRVSGQSDGRPLSQQYADPNNPMPDYEVRDQLQNQGVAPGDLDREVQSVEHNDPPSGSPHPEFSLDNRDLPSTVADPVITFTGQYAQTVTDVVIASRGFPLRLVRIYRSGTVYFGPWGYNWDHNYNVYLRVLTDGSVAVWTGHLSEDLYRPVAGGYQPPVGVFRRLEHLTPPADPIEGYVITEAGGNKLTFETPIGWPLADRIPLIRVEDRHGNTHGLQYDAEGRLEQVTDDAGRFMLFGYGDCGLLETVSDHLGRTWTYWHDSDIEHLIAVTTPSTPDQVDGRTTRYDYDRWQAHPALVHNMLRVIAANGEVVVENQYGQDPGTYDFGRVVYQSYGGYEATFEATVLQYVPRDPSMVDVPFLQVQVVDPGVLKVYTFNYRGDLLDERFRLALDRTYRVCARTYRYDDQGNLSERYDPDGHGYLYTYDNTNVDPLARGNLLSVTEVPTPLAIEVPRVVLRATYENRYQLPQTLIDVAGSTTGYVYDYQLVGVGTGKLTEVRHPQITLPDGSVTQAVEHLHYNSNGQLVHHELEGETHDFDYYSAGPVTGYLSRHAVVAGGATITEQFGYDSVGNLLTKTDGSGNITRYTVNPLGEVLEVDPPDGTKWEFHWDPLGHLAYTREPRGDYDDPTLGGNPIRHEFTFDALGHLTREAYAVNTVSPRTIAYERSADGKSLRAVDALGRTTLRRYDERGLTLDETLFDTTGTVAFHRTYTYSRNGQLINAGLDGGPQLQVGYDAFGQLRQIIAPDSARVAYTRDVRGKVVVAEAFDTQARGGGLLARRRYDYDERGGNRREMDVLFDAPGGPFTDVVTTFWLDDAGRPWKIEEPAGLARSRTYGPNSALLEESDSLGNRVLWTLDAAGRVSLIEITEAGPAGTTAGTWQRVYDARGRVTSETDPLGNGSRYQYDDRGVITAATNPIGTVMNIRSDALGATVMYELDGNAIAYQRDAMGRITSITDPAGTTTGVDRDAQDRVVRTRRVDGQNQLFVYDVGGALANFTDFDGTNIAYVNNAVGLPTSIAPAAAAGVLPTPASSLSWDGLRRLTAASAGADNRTLTYDSINRLRADAATDTVRLDFDAPGRVRHLTYPDGRRDRIDLDQLGRLVSVTQEAPGILPLGAQGLAPGTTLLNVDWAGANRIAHQDQAGGLLAELAYDGAFRLARSAQRDPTGSSVQQERCVRDGLGLRRAVSMIAPSADERAYAYDGTSRLTNVHAGLAPGTVPSNPETMTQAAQDAAATSAMAAPFTSETRITYSSGDTPRNLVELDGAGNVLSTRTFSSNALHQLTNVDGLVPAYDTAGNLRQIGTRSYDYDAYRRLVAVRDGATVLATFEYDALSRLLTRTEGGTPVRFAYLGNNLLQETRASGLTQYVPGPGIDQLLIRSTSNSSHLLSYDLMGSLAATSDIHGTVLERYQYSTFGIPVILDPAGLVTRPSSAVGINPSFLGREYVSSCGLYCFRDRFYDPTLLAFLQPDPILFGDSWSPYAFVRFNPINFHDPYGRFLQILIGAVVGAAIGGVGAWLSGGDVKDILVGMGAGAVGGAIAATGAIALGAAVSGGIMGAWSGGRTGYSAGGVGGAIMGGSIGLVVGAGIGYVGGSIGAKVGNVVATNMSGLINRTLVANGVSKGTSWVVGRYGGMITGGYAGGAASGLFSNTASTVAIDVATGRPVTGTQIWDATKHSFEIDGPLNTVGAVGDRFVMIRDLAGTTSNVFGAEGEILVSRDLGVQPARGSEDISVNGNTRRPDFPTARTLDQYNAVVEVKNKAYVFDERGGQLTDFSDFAAQNGGDLWAYTRPGADVAGTVLALPNTSIRPIPQLPMVIAVPVPEFDRKGPSK